MRGKVLLATTIAAAVLLVVGVAVAWAAIGGSHPMTPRAGTASSVYGHDGNAMHRGLGKAQLGRMRNAYADAMPSGQMMDADDMARHMGSTMMGPNASDTDDMGSEMGGGVMMGRSSG